MSSKKYLYEIDFVRSVAVIAVIGFHFGNGLFNSGYLGVDLFFVISGFLIGKIYNSTDFFDKRNVTQYFKSRFLRIYPALIFCVLTTSIFLSLLKRYSNDELRESLSVLYGASNMYYFFSEMDYFALPTNSLFFKHTWTLGVEITFYILFPLIIFAFQNLTRIKFLKITFIRFVVFLSLISFIYFVLYQNWNEMAAFYLFPGRFWQFGLGVLAFTLKNSYIQSINSIFIVASIFVVVSNSQIINTFGINQVLISALAFIFLNKVKDNNLKLNFCKNKFLLYPGKISYSLYLWHWPILLFSKLNMGIYKFPLSIQFLLLISFSLFSYYIIEKPSRTRFIKSRFKNRYILIILCSVSILLFISSKTFLPNLYRLNNPNIFIPTSFDLLKDGGTYTENCVLASLNAPISSSQAEKCSKDSNLNSSPRIYAFGDSHVGHLQGLLNKINQELNISYTLIESPGNFFPTYKKTTTNFNTYLSKNISAQDIIFISRYYLDRKTLHLNSDVNLWFKTVDSFIRENNLDRNMIIIFGPPPNFFFDDINICNVSLRNCDVPRVSYEKDMTSFYEAAKILSGRKNVYLINSFNVFCPKIKEYCSPIENNIYLFRDRDHLNTYGSSLLFNDVKKILLKYNNPNL